MLSDDGWNKWQEFVLNKLNTLETQYQSLDRKIDKLIEDVAGLKVKAGVWGMLGGAIPIIIGLGIWILRS